MLDSIKAFCRALEKAGIKHKLEEYAGDHTNRVHMRLRDDVLPCFSDALTFVGPARSGSVIIPQRVPKEN